MSRPGGSEEQWQDQSPLKAGRAERRSLWLGVLLPFFAVLAVVAAIIGLTLSLRSPLQVALLTDAMLTALTLVPLVICLFPLVIASLGLVALFSRWHQKSRSPLRRLEAWTALMEHNVEGWLSRVDSRVLEWAVRLAPLRELLTSFDPPNVEAGDEEIE